jgi:hypothetical protein
MNCAHQVLLMGLLFKLATCQLGKLILWDVRWERPLRPSISLVFALPFIPYAWL